MENIETSEWVMENSGCIALIDKAKVTNQSCIAEYNYIFLGVDCQPKCPKRITSIQNHEESL